MKSLVQIIFIVSACIILNSTMLFSQGNMILVDSQSSDWIDTNIPIIAGDTIFIEASGYIAGVHSGKNINLFQYLSPNGISTYTNPTNLIDNSSPFFSLIGKIGQNGDPFYIGTKTDLIYSNEDGNLFMIVNDCVPCHYDNFGYYSAVVFIGSEVTSVGSIFNNNPEEFIVFQNYPNPFNPNTTINYSVSNSSNLHIVIYDINGQIVRNLIDEHKNVGDYSVVWDGKNDRGELLSSGTYFYQVQVGNFIQTKKMILLK